MNELWLAIHEWDEARTVERRIEAVKKVDAALRRAKVEGLLMAKREYAAWLRHNNSCELGRILSFKEWLDARAEVAL